MRITRPFVLLTLAALLAPCAEASRTSVWESNPPASAVLAKADAASALAALAPAAAADAETTELQIFNLGDVVLNESALEHEDRFNLGPLELLSPAPLRGPPSSYPETRVRGFELLPPFRGGASPSLSLWSRRACGSISCGLVSDSPEDPWGLNAWSSIQGYVAGITEEADPTGLLPEVESIDAGYGSGTRDAEDFEASKAAGKWTLRGLTFIRTGIQQLGKAGLKHAAREAAKKEAKKTGRRAARSAAERVVEESSPPNTGPVPRPDGSTADRGSRRPTRDQRDRLFEDSKDDAGVPRCEYCEVEITREYGNPNSYELDHRTAWSRGGPTSDENLAGSCRTCNREKGPLSEEEYRQRRNGKR